MRWPAVQALAKDWKDDSNTLPILKRCLQDESDLVRKHALAGLVEHIVWKDSPEIVEIIFHLAGSDPCEVEKNRNWDWNESPRFIALKAMIAHYPIHPKTLELLAYRAANDPNERLQQWAQEQLKIQNVKLKMKNMNNG
nr:HEAT repeat domain-containing protein [Dendronalium sp. ChiSLP03b]MDZ8209208.1 HEAT repeat domain-containing protein [Dendronalium sp. ChiSLP03b]